MPDDGVRAALAAQAEPEIGFNYLGQFDQGIAAATRFRFAGGRRGREVAVENRRPHLLAVGGGIAGGQLQLSWTYDEGAHRRETIERLAQAYADALRGIIAHCREADAGGYTPSDFPLAQLSQAELDAVLAGRRDVEDLYPLSPMQEGMLFHAIYGDAMGAYHAQTALRLEGELDVELLRRAWAEVVGRHAVLRTGFVWQGVQRPLQRVHASVEVPWLVEDWSHVPAGEQPAALERFLADDRARGFRLDEPPLMRNAVFRTGDGAQWLVWSQHHLMMDGWAVARVVNDVFRLYAAWSTGRTVELKRVRPYREYIGWLQRQDMDAAERYWRGALAGFSTPTALPADRAAGTDGDDGRAKRGTRLSPAATERLEEAARRHGVTLSTVLQGAWGLLLARHAGEDDVLFGTTVSGRPPALDGVEDMIGLFINTLPVRVRVPGDARLGAWLGELQRAGAESREYEYSPLVQVQGWSEVPRGVPLFDIHYIFENYPAESAGTGGAQTGLRITESRGIEWSTYALSLMAVPGTELQLNLRYDTTRFSAATIDRMLGQLERVLEQVAAGGDVPLSELEILAGDERALVLDTWTATDAPFPDDACLHELIEAQARRAPDAPAVAFGERTLTYGELDRAANRLAHVLRERGVGPEARVALALEPSPEMIVSLLAMLKAGGAYLPLDPGSPAERLSWLLGNAGARLVLADAAGAGALPADGPPVLRVAPDGFLDRPETAPESGVGAGNLAYVIYTSGSTGRPKGVLVEHRGVCNSTTAFIDVYGIRPGRGCCSSRPCTSTRRCWTCSRRSAPGPRWWWRPATPCSPASARGAAAGPAGHARQGDPVGPGRRAGGGAAGAGGRDRGRRDLQRGAGGALGARAALLQRLRAHGAQRALHGAPLRAARRSRRPSAGPSPTRGCTCWTSGMRPVPVGVPGELYLGGAGRHPRLREPSRPLGRALRPRPVRGRGGGADVPLGRPRALAARRYAGVRGPGGLPGEGAGLPHRAGRGGGGPAGAPGPRGRRGRGPRVPRRTPCWPRTSWPARTPGRPARPSCGRSSSSASPSTWCRRAFVAWTPCRSPPTARWTAARSPSRGRTRRGQTPSRRRARPRRRSWPGSSPRCCARTAWAARRLLRPGRPLARWPRD